MKGRESHVLARLIVAAEAGAPCPSNSRLIEGLSSHDCAAAEVLGSLARRGVVVVERQGLKRRVTIAASGARTGWTAIGSAAPSRDRTLLNDDGPKMSAAEIAARRVERSACPWCAVRSDVGCQHSRRIAA